MLPISPMADWPISDSASTPSIPHRTAASAAPMSSRTIPSISPTTPITTPVTSSSGEPIISIASVNDTAAAAGTEMSTERPSMPDSEVLALPEPMLASSRRASSWSSVKCLLIGSGFLSGSGRDGDSGDGGGRRGGGHLRAGGRESVAVDDQGDLAAGEHGAAGERRALGDLRRKRAGYQLALADQVVGGEHEAPVGAVHDHAVPALTVGRPAEHRSGVDDRQHAVVEDEHPGAGDRADRVVGELDRALDAVDRHRERAVVDLDKEGIHDRQRERQPDHRGGARSGL